MEKKLKNRIGYYFKIIGLIAIFLSFLPIIQAQQTNCSDGTAPIDFEYVIPIRNITTTGDYIPIDYATCNITIFKDQLGQNNTINSTQLINNNDGSYSCFIRQSFPAGKYSTFYNCTAGTLNFQNFGRFEVILDWVPISITIGIALIATLFLFISFRSEDKLLNPLFFFLGNLMIIIDIFVASLLSADIPIKTILERIYSVFIILYGVSLMLYIFLGWFFPFIIKAFVKTKSDDEITGEVE